MKRRKALKAIVIGSAMASAGEARGALRAVNPPEQAVHASRGASTASAVFSPNYFSKHEFAVISGLADLIIPRDTTPGALDAHVSEYIDLQASKMPDVQTQMSGGVQWLGRYCSEEFGRDFLECRPAQQTQVLDKLAYRKGVPPELKQARSFFVPVRSLTCDGFYSSKLRFQELGYKGNTFVTEWHGCTHPEHGV